MKKLPILGLSAVLVSTSFIGCNSDDEAEYTDFTSSNVGVSAFSLTQDDSVLINLDTVFFSIDLVNGLIFNADSLPYGTRTDKLIPRIVFQSSPSVANLVVERENGTDTTYNYLTNSTDSIDFSRGPVRLDVTSFSGNFKKSYQLKVNVHQLKPDSLVWNRAALRALPTPYASPKAQRTVRTSDGLYCLSTDGSAWNISHAETPEADSWTETACNMPADADVNTFTATDEAFFIIAGGKLFTSADKGASWSDTGEKWHNIYGAYGKRIIGCTNAGGAWQTVDYPAVVGPSALPEGMPVYGTSQAITMTFEMSPRPQMYVVGGEISPDSLSVCTWAYDGSAWANLTSKRLPKGLKNMTLVPFFAFTINSTWIASRYSIILAYGGTDGTENNRTMFVSDDCGISWYTTSSLMQLPDYVAAKHSAQAFVYDLTLTDEGAMSLWSEIPLYYRLPASAILEQGSPVSRATEPITSWTCPYIYTFGGVEDDGTLSPTIWRATLNRLTFKPLQ